MESFSTAHLFIEGRVQGVGYRQAMFRQAKALGLRGWVRNLPDGRVEAVLEGPEALQEQILAWCYDGPALAKVTNIEVSRESLDSSCDSFFIR